MWTASDNKYDIVCYLRTNLWFFNLLAISELSTAQQHKDHLYTPDFHMWGGLNDRLAFGVPQVMSIYGNRLDMAKSYAKEHPLHSETFLKAAMQQADVECSFSSIRFARVRATGELWSIWHNESDMQNSEPAMRPHLHVITGHHGFAQLEPL
ncbi:TPA: hypothetical protein ACH3X2_010576 [Trebouxia sp. C0005]